jgi:hypothetical protein
MIDMIMFQLLYLVTVWKYILWQLLFWKLAKHLFSSGYQVQQLEHHHVDQKLNILENILAWLTACLFIEEGELVQYKG